MSKTYEDYVAEIREPDDIQKAIHRVKQNVFRYRRKVKQLSTLAEKVKAQRMETHYLRVLRSLRVNVFNIEDRL
jgi:hypothetical protein